MSETVSGFRDVGGMEFTSFYFTNGHGDVTRMYESRQRLMR
jgi:hypothetical protein